MPWKMCVEKRKLKKKGDLEESLAIVQSVSLENVDFE